MTLPLVSWSVNTTAANLEASELVQKIHGISDFVHSDNRIVNLLTDEDLSDLPLAIEHTVNGKEQYILIDNLRLGSTEVLIDIYMLVDMPVLNRKMAFAALDVKIHDGGIASATGSRSSG